MNNKSAKKLLVDYINQNNIKGCAKHLPAAKHENSKLQVSYLENVNRNNPDQT